MNTETVAILKLKELVRNAIDGLNDVRPADRDEDLITRLEDGLSFVENVLLGDLE